MMSKKCKRWKQKVSYLGWLMPKRVIQIQIIVLKHDYPVGNKRNKKQCELKHLSSIGE